MPWGAIIGAGVSLFAGRKSRKKAKKAMEQEAYFREKELQLGQDQFDFSKRIYDEHKAQFDPIFDSMLGQIDDTAPDYAAISGDVDMAFDTARGMEERDMQRYGIRPDSGAARQAQREYGIRRGAANVGARSAARQGAKDKRYGRYADLYNSGQGIATQNAAGVTNALANQQAGYRNAGYNSRADAQYYDRQGNADAAGWGAMIGGIDWAGAWEAVKGWGSGGTGATVPGSGGQSPQQFYSDARLKENVRHVGVDQGVNIYTWDWNEIAQNLGITDPTIGVLAQEHLDSGFVRQVDGYFKVDYAGLFAPRRVS